MIHPSLQIHVLDIDSGEPMLASVEDVFRHYVERARAFHDEQSIDFKDANVKIMDWTGWTRLLRIKKMLSPGPHWYTLTIPGTDKSIMVGADEDIVVYDKSQAVIGYHGEVKFLFRFKSPYELNENDLLRVRRMDEEDDLLNHFTPVIVTSNGRCTEPEYIYAIETESMFYNGNDFHMCADNACGMFNKQKKHYK